MTTINQHGWEFILPHDVVVEWDGELSSSSSHVKILSGEYLPNGQKIVDSGTANGTVTFNLNAVIETDTEHYTLLSGPPNYFIDGAIAMNALIRTDWYHYNPLQFCWKLTIPNKQIIFPKGMPFVFIMPYPKNLISNTSITIKNIKNEIKEKIEKYSLERSKFYLTHGDFQWSNMYRNGVNSLEDHAEKYIDKVFRPTPQKPIIDKKIGEDNA